MTRSTLTIEKVAALDADGLQEAWLSLNGQLAPSLPPGILRLALAYELQRRRSGGLSRAALAVLNGRGRSGTQQAAPQRPTLRPGSHLVRTWHGVTHSVIVKQDGFVYQDRRYSSLSAIAREITGGHWSGPRFFGVRGA